MIKQHFKTCNRYKLVSEEAQRKLVELNKTHTIKEMADYFGVTDSTISRKLIQITGKRKAKPYNMSKDKVVKTTSGYKRVKNCKIDQAIEICKSLGYESSADYIFKKGREDFIQNIRPQLK